MAQPRTLVPARVRRVVVPQQAALRRPPAALRPVGRRGGPGRLDGALPLAGGRGRAHDGHGPHGFQGYGFHLFTNHFVILRAISGLIKNVFVSSNWGPLTVYFKQYPWNPLGPGHG